MAFALTHLLGVGSLAALFYASGSLLTPIIRAPIAPKLGAFLSRAALGVTAWMYLLFALAAVGLYRVAVVLPLAAIVLATWLERAVRQVWLAREHGREPRARASGRARACIATLCCALPSAVVLAAAFFPALSPHIGWDDNVYHLTLPKRYLEHGGFRPLPFSVYSHWPHAVELVYGLALMLADQVLAKLVHTLFLAFVLLGVYRLVRAHGGRGLACMATLFVIGNEVVLFEAPLAYIDIAFAFFLLVAVAYADEFSRTRSHASLVMAGVYCGAVAGTKLSGLSAVICVGVCVLLAQPRALERGQLPRLGLALALPTLLLALPWFLKTYLYTGNPIYPFVYQRFGGPEWSAKLGRDFYHWQQSIGMGRSLHDYLVLPLRVVLEGRRGYERFDGGFGKFWLAAVPLALFASCIDRTVRTFTACACLYFVFWALSSQQARFLIAILPLLAVAAAIAAEFALAKLAPARAHAGGGALLAALAGLYAWPALQPFCADGLASARRYLVEGPEDPASAVPEGYRYVNRQLPKSAKLMLININRGFFLEREYIADSFFEASQMNWIISGNRSEPELNAALRGLGITHVYVDHSNWGIPYPPLWNAFLQDRHFAKREYRCHDGSCAIYKLRK